MASKFWVPLVVTGCVSGTGGNPRLTVGSTAGLLVGTVVNIATAPGGVTGVSGSMTVSAIVDGAHFEVTGTFGGAYTSGGLIGGGNWTSTSTANWSGSTGGAPGSAVPVAGDAVSFDALSGGGTVTVAATFNTGNSLGSFIFGAFSGALDFLTNSPNVTITGSGATAFSGTGAGTRTFNMGNGLWKISNSTTTTFSMNAIGGLVFNANSSTIEITGNTASVVNFLGGGLPYNVVTFDLNTLKGGVAFSGTNSFANLSLSPGYYSFPNGVTTTITTLTLLSASASNPISLASNTAAAATLSIGALSGSFDWCAFRGITFAGAASPITANDCFDLGLNTSLIANPPSGGAHIIGG
jgi:hypothetical protein